MTMISGMEMITMDNESQKLVNIELSLYELRQRVKRLEVQQAKYVTPKELAGIMHCSASHIYKSIRSGKITTVNIAGVRRIPLSQFFNNTVEENIFPRNKESNDFMETLKAYMWK